MSDNVVLRSIEWKNRRVFVRFSFAPGEGAKRSPRLAVIPLGKLPLGNFSVTIERLPAEQAHLAAGYKDPPHRRYSDICASCMFHVVEGPGGAPPPPELVEIPLDTIWAYKMPGAKDINEFGALNAEDLLVQNVLLQISESWHQHSGMVLQGEGREALEELYRIRKEKRPWNDMSTVNVGVLHSRDPGKGVSR